MFLLDIFQNEVLLLSIFSCFLAQFIKIFTGSKKIDITRILTSGGMPSSHSSFVTTLSVMVGYINGFNSTEFAIATVFALITMYDASGVRQAVGKQAAILNQIIEDIHRKKEFEHNKLKELIGHTPKEVLLGALLGITVAMVYLYFRNGL